MKSTPRAKKLTQENTALRNMLLRALSLLEGLERDAAVRLPYGGFEQAVKDLRAAMKA